MQPIYVFPGAFEPSEARSFQRIAESEGFTPTGHRYPPRYRNNERVVLDSEALADQVLERIRPHLPRELSAPDGSRWKLRGLNQRFRFCRYRNGQSFTVHRDGVYHESKHARSMLTFMIYLNDADQFVGGQTRFFTERDRETTSLTVEPRCGTLIVFDHALWHEGMPVTAGTKMIMRSDVIYEHCDEATLETEGHAGYVWKLGQIEGNRIASAGRDGTVREWRVDQGLEQTAVHRGYRGSVSALAISSAGAIWSGGRDGSLYVRDRESLQVQRRAHEGAVLSMVALDNERIASAGAEGSIHLWSSPIALEQTLLGHRSWVWSLALRSDGVIASASEDGDVRLWSPATGETISVLGAGKPLRSVCVLSDWRVVGGCDDGELIVWDGQQVAARVHAHAGAIRSLAELADGSLVSAGEDQSCKVWSPTDLHVRATHPHDDFVTDIAVLPDGRFLTASYDSRIRVHAAP